MKKRGQNEGCITRRKDGRWAGVYTVGVSEDGKQQRKFIYGRTRSEVAVELNQALMAKRADKFIDPKGCTLIDWLLYWMKQYVISKVSLSTRISYDGYISKHISTKIGSVKLALLRGDMLQSFFNERHENGRLDGKGGLSPKTLKNMFNMLHSALDMALKNDLILKNPCNNVILPQMVKHEICVLSVSEQQRLIEVSRTERLGIGVVLTLFTGLRLGELLGLQWSSLDLVNGVLIVKQSLNRLKNYDDSDSKTSIVLGKPKTLNSMRQIPLHEIMKNELMTYRKMQEDEKAVAKDLYSDQNFVIANEIGDPIEPRTYQS